MKQTILNVMLTTGAFVPFRRLNRGKALILMYHRFAQHEDEDGAKTSARSFVTHLEYLKAHYRLAPLSLISEHIHTGKRLPPATAAVTIDDGYRDAYTVAFPLLRERKIPATLFVATGFVDLECWLWTDKMRYVLSHTKARKIEVNIGDRKLSLALGDQASRAAAASRVNSLLKTMPDAAKDNEIMRLAALLSVEIPKLPPEEFQPLTWDEAREMEHDGIEIGSHTRSHPILTKVDDVRLQAELCESKSRLETIFSRRIDLFCYPNGNMDERVRRAAAQAGYRCAVTVEPGLVNGKSDPLALRRLAAESDYAHFVQSTSGFETIKNKLLHGSSRAELHFDTREANY
jgi:peptidoglycan/xylan/chitin deacetylase (PgdA/CDA1 family)